MSGGSGKKSCATTTDCEAEIRKMSTKNNSQISPSAARKRLGKLRGTPRFIKRRDPDCMPKVDSKACDIFVGNQSNARDVENLMKMEIGAVLNCAPSVCKDPLVAYKKHGISYLELDLHDKEGFNIIEEAFKSARKFIDKNHKAGRSVLVHCFAGVNRSATLVVAYLMMRYKIPLLPLYGRCYKARNGIVSNKSFQLQLCELAYKNGLLPSSKARKERAE